MQDIVARGPLELQPLLRFENEPVAALDRPAHRVRHRLAHLEADAGFLFEFEDLGEAPVVHDQLAINVLDADGRGQLVDDGPQHSLRRRHGLLRLAERRFRRPLGVDADRDAAIAAEYAVPVVDRRAGRPHVVRPVRRDRDIFEIAERTLPLHVLEVRGPIRILARVGDAGRFPHRQADVIVRDRRQGVSAHIPNIDETVPGVRFPENVCARPGPIREALLALTRALLSGGAPMHEG